MANIHIKELFGSDDITALVEKVNFNFDQLILAGGGPEGPKGATGSQGVAGPEGIRGSQWFGGTGATGTINLPTDGVFRDNDWKLDPNGDVDYYDGGTWVFSGTNLRGPTGPQGPTGDGAIALLPGLSQVNPDYTVQQFTPTFSNLSDWLGKNFINDKDDYIASGDYINAGVDYVAFGRGNNSVVLGRYASLFRNDATGSGATYSPADGNKTMGDFPVIEANVPMLLIAQNDYKAPASNSNEYSNGIAIGLNKTQAGASYSGDVPYGTQDGPSYNDFTKISIENSFFDFKIESPQMIHLSGSASLSKFRLGVDSNRITFNDVHDFSTILNSPIYTEFNIDDSFVVELDGSGRLYDVGNISISDFDYAENKRTYTPTNDRRAGTAKSFISSDGWGAYTSNEIVLLNDTTLNEATGVGATGKKINDYKSISALIEFDSNYKSFPFRLGQTVLAPNVMNGIDSSETFWNKPFIDGSSAINISYQGFGYDQSFVQYSGVDETNGAPGSDNINNGGSKSLSSLIPNSETLEKYLGYDIRQALGTRDNPNGDQKGSRSMSRMGLYPGLFREEKVGGVYQGDKDSRKEKFFDVAHRMLPTGSMDFYGTVRLRQQETTDLGAQDGWIAINKKDGIVTFEEPNLVNAVPTGAVMMFSEMSSDKFSFFTFSDRTLGSSGGGKATSYLPGSTGYHAAFMGKGSEELKDYYVCNGAVLADARDIIVTGPFSKMKGMNIIAGDGTSFISNSELGLASDFDYELNDDYEGKAGQDHDDIQMPTVGKNLSEFARDFFNNQSKGYEKEFWGYSVLAPGVADSGFRVVLPNYFGKIPKMMFPDSDMLIKAIAGDKLTSPAVLNQPQAESGFKYLTDAGEYNSSWMMRGMFDIGGFPYILGNQSPRLITNDTGDHAHRIPNDRRFTPNAVDETDFEYGAWSNNYGSPVYTNTVGIHAHHINRFDIDGVRRDILKYFGFLGDPSGVYSKNSNWVNVSADMSGGQKFVQPPYKGTLMAINLKGLRNPKRTTIDVNGNTVGTIIKDLHFVGGVPISGAWDHGADMSWFSTMANDRQGSWFTSSGYFYQSNTSILDNAGNPDTVDMDWYNLNAYEYGFKDMARNDDTMHPYTFFNENVHVTDTRLDYNAYENPSNPEKAYNYLYKTHSTRSDYYN